MPEPSHTREDYKAARDGSILADLGGHLGELRNRIFIALAAIIVVFLVAFNYSSDLIQFLQALAPRGSSFFQLKPGELLMTSIKVSLFTAIALSMPIWLQQLDAFIKPGLKEKEAKVIRPILVFSPLLFWLGLVFAYYLALPPLLDFLLGFGEGVVESNYGLEHFINLELSIMSLCGISFQLPIILICLAQFGIVTAQSLLSIWRYVVLGAFVIAAIITPTPDPLTMTLLASALLGLYFTTVVILLANKSKTRTEKSPTA